MSLCSARDWLPVPHLLFVPAEVYVRTLMRLGRGSPGATACTSCIAALQRGGKSFHGNTFYRADVDAKTSSVVCVGIRVRLLPRKFNSRICELTSVGDTATDEINLGSRWICAPKGWHLASSMFRASYLNLFTGEDELTRRGCPVFLVTLILMFSLML